MCRKSPDLLHMGADTETVLEGQNEMARKPLSQLPDWELEHKEEDIRGKTLQDESGKQLGKVSDMILDTDIECAVEVVLDNGSRYPADRIDIRNGKPFLLSQPKRRPAEAGERTIPLAEERIRIRRTREKAGEVEVGKEVTSHRETMEVPVSHEEVYVEEETIKARPAERPIGAGEEETISMPVYEEEIKPEKETVVTREIHVGKEKEEETRTVTEELKREEPRIERHGDVEVHEEGEEGRRAA